MERIFNCYHRDGTRETFKVEITDDYFYQTLYDKNGNPVKVLKERVEPVRFNGKILYSDLDAPAWPFILLDKGHCLRCGYISCRGTCM